MSSREQAINLINAIPEYKLQYIVSFLRGFQLDDEIEDMMFCQRLVDEYEADDSPDKDDVMSIDELRNELGL